MAYRTDDTDVLLDEFDGDFLSSEYSGVPAGVDNLSFATELRGTQGEVETNGASPVPTEMEPTEIRFEVVGEKKKTFFLIRWICQRPCLMFFLALFGHMLFIAITVLLFFTGFNILPIIFDDMPVFNIYDTMYQRNLAWMERDKTYHVFLFMTQYPTRRKKRSVDRLPPDMEELKKRSLFRSSLNLMYITPDNTNVFTKRRLDAIQKFEKQINQSYNWRGEKASDAHWICEWESVSDIFTNDSSGIRQDKIGDKWHIAPYLGKDSVVDKRTGHATSSATRTFSQICYTGSFRNITLWSVDSLMPALVAREKEFLTPVGIKLYFWNYRGMFSESIYRQAINDAFYFIGSISFIFLFMWIQTASFFVTAFGTFSIITSFIGANLIYNCVIGYQFLGLFNLMALFVVLGIGADDIFVFFDTWKSLQHITNMEDRMTATYRRAGAAMFTTSLTTMVAFFVSSFSQILPISSFGTFAGLTVFVNYMSVITFFPTVVAVHHCYFEKCFSCNKNIGSYDLNPPVRNRAFIAVTRFFQDKFYPVITHTVWKGFSIAAFVILIGGMTYSCTGLRLDQDSTMKAFKGNNPLETALHKTAYDFKLGVDDKMVTVYLVWGLGPRNMSKCDRLKYVRWKPCPGEQVIDEDFDIEPPENQLALLNICKNLTSITGRMRDDMELTPNDNGKGNKIYCFMEYFDIFLRRVSKMLSEHPLIPYKGTLKVPVTRKELEPLIPILGGFVGLELNTTKIEHPVQTVMAIFIEKNATQLLKFVGFRKDKRKVIGKYSGGKPVYDQKLKYASIVVPLTEQEFRIAVDQAIILQNLWENYMTEWIAKMPRGLRKGWQVSNSWFLARQKQNLMYRALSGVAISLALAFVVLLFTTRNFLLAFLAEITLTGAVVCVIGVMPLVGWPFGVLESINVCFVAGLAVDYIVHIVEAYHMSTCTSSKKRTQDALGKIGVSVLSGAVTTLGASSFMFFSEIFFFMQFGTFIFCTVGFSLLFALLFFPALLHTFGPSGPDDIGSFRWLYEKFRS